MHHNKFPAPAAFAGAGDHMKWSASELALEALLRPLNYNGTSAADTGDSGSGRGLFGNFNHHAAGFVSNPPPAVDDLASFGFKSQENINGLSTCGGLGESQSWYQNLNPQQQACVLAPIDSQSSICAGSPTSTLKPKTGDNQGSGSSEDEEDAEIDGGSCEQSNDCVDVKRTRRKVSNRESARRSRLRKQAQLQDLEMQVEQLHGENVTLFKQLNDASQQLRDASTNNRVLKSDVEALRAKVKLAEDIVTRGSLSCSLNQLLQTQLGSSTQLLNATLSRMADMSPTITVQGQDGNFGGAFPGMGNDNMDHHVLNGNGNGNSNGLVSDAMSGVSEMWPNWESQVSTHVPK